MLSSHNIHACSFITLEIIFSRYRCSCEEMGHPCHAVAKSAKLECNLICIGAEAKATACLKIRGTNEINNIPNLNGILSVSGH